VRGVSSSGSSSTSTKISYLFLVGMGFLLVPVEDEARASWDFGLEGDPS